MRLKNTSNFNSPNSLRSASHANTKCNLVINVKHVRTNEIENPSFLPERVETKTSARCEDCICLRGCEIEQIEKTNNNSR
jgi:hypothetical protein